jgi:hypothetical protein
MSPLCGSSLAPIRTLEASQRPESLCITEPDGVVILNDREQGEPLSI